MILFILIGVYLILIILIMMFMRGCERGKDEEGNDNS